MHIQIYAQSVLNQVIEDDDLASKLMLIYCINVQKIFAIEMFAWKISTMTRSTSGSIWQFEDGMIEKY